MLNLLLILSPIKFPLGIKLYLNIIPVLIGLYHWIVKREFHRAFIPLLLLIALGSLHSLYHFEIKSLARLGQLLCMVGFANFISKKFEKIKWPLVFKSITIISLIVLILEWLLFREKLTPKNFFGFYIPRFSGLVGESNYSGMLMAFTTIALWNFKQRTFSTLSFIQIFMTASRSSLVTVFLFFIFNSIWSLKLKRLNKFIILSFLLFLFLLPLTLYLIHMYAPESTKIFLETSSAGRFYLYIPYVEMGLQNLVGIGYFQGWDNYATYLAPYKEYVDSIRGHQLNEQHNIIIQVFSEFGLLGHILFTAFLYKILDISRHQVITSKLVPLFMAIIGGYMFLNGLNEYLLYMVFGIIISKEHNQTHFIKIGWNANTKK